MVIIGDFYGREESFMNVKKYIKDEVRFMKDWDWEENNRNNLFPDKITLASRKRVFWKCHICSGTWNTQVKERNGCPYCSGFYALPGFNDLATTHPELSLQWDYSKNQIRPEDVTHGSHKKVFWNCNKGHSWDAQINSRVKGQGCPYCNNKRVLTGYNDLETINPNLAKEWDYEKNESLKPSEVVFGSKKKVWWRCSNNHSWQAQIIYRNNGRGCPVCANRKIVKNYNDFASEHPELLIEWDFEKNEKAPSEYACFSREKVWWICKKGHSWKAAIGDRSRGNGCAKCTEERRVSFPEKALLFYISKAVKNVVGNYRTEWLGAYELDIYLPEYKIGIEYDGTYGHSSEAGIERDIRKNNVCNKNGVTLIRIREYGCPLTNSTSLDYILNSGNRIDEAVILAIEAIKNITGIGINFSETDVDIDRDSGEIYSLIEYSEKENSLLNKNPKVALMWHPTKNGKLTPENVSIMSSKVVWWKGECNHEWKSSVSYEASSGLCPYCSGKRVLVGFNDLSTTNPNLAEEWDDERNGSVTPNNITAGSGKIVWWKCNKGHSWKASIVSRNRGNGCPICANRIVMVGYNDVASVAELVREWDYEKNTIEPEEACIGSEKKVWWICRECGHNWKTSINKRFRGSMCPECAKSARSATVAKTYTERSGSVANKRPDLIEEWDWERNENLDPLQLTCGSTKKAWWVCKTCKHVWYASVASRTRKCGGACPKCADIERAKKRQELILKRKSSIQVTHPNIAREWNYEKNQLLSPDRLTAGSGRRVWWICSNCGNEWDAVIGERTRGRSKCPKCNNKN